jgi:hypothetical protein
MRYKHFTKDELYEVRMTPTALKQFAETPEAGDILAGFEAELYFRDVLGGGGSDEQEKDWDRDERVASIHDCTNFFDDSDHNGRRDIERLSDRMYEDYYDWQNSQISGSWEDNGQDYLAKWLSNNVGDDDVAEMIGIDYNDDTHLTRENYSDAAEISWENQDNYYDQAREEYEEEMREDEDYDEESWLRSEGIRHASDVENYYDITWPYWTGGERESGGFDEDIAQALANNLSRSLGIRTEVYQGGSKRDDTWYFESDGSLDEMDDSSEDMGCEITSPPLPLRECLVMLERFYEWAAEEGAYTNNSTGFHMGLSFKLDPTVHMGSKSHANVDFLKLALFLGDRHVLKQFEREGSTWCKSALGKIETRVKSEDDVTSEKVQSAFDLIGHNLIELAQKQLGLSSKGFSQKYTSINPHASHKRYNHVDYIEFRSAGGDYLEELEKIQNTLLRYSKALYLASDPHAERQEYAKKLTKLLGLGMKGNPISQLFARYQAKQIDGHTLKSLWKEIHPDAKLGKPAQQGTGDYEFYNVSSPSMSYDVVRGITNQQAEEHAAEIAHDNNLRPDEVGYRSVLRVPPHTVRTTVRSQPLSQEEQLRYEIVNSSNGNIVIAFRAPSDEDALAELDTFRRRYAGTPLHIRLAGPTTANEPTQPAPSQHTSAEHFSGYWKILDADDNELHRFNGVGNNQGDANRIAAQWIRSNGVTGSGFSVVPVMSA